MQKCPSVESGEAGKAESCKGCPNAKICSSAKPDEDIPLIKKRLESIKIITAVMSGKGGVGKSTIARNIATAMANKGIKTLILDFDLSGPSIPRLTKTEESFILQNDTGFAPIQIEENLGVVSVGHLEEADEKARVFSTNLKNYAIKKILKLCDFTEYEAMVIDTPPNITEEHLALANYIKPHFAVMVSTPQALSLNDVRRQVAFCKKIGVRIIGMIENMKGFDCTKCGHTNNAHKNSRIEEFCKIEGIPYSGYIPIRAEIAKSSDSGIPVENQIFSNLSEAIIEGLRTI